jgi:hypothetical protein
MIKKMFFKKALWATQDAELDANFESNEKLPKTTKK